MVEKARFNYEFGLRVKLARKNINLRAEAAAEAAGISPQFLSDVERGLKGMGSYNVAKLALALGVTTDYLIYGREEAQRDWELAAEHLSSLPPAQRDMAVHMLNTMLTMLKESAPE